MKWILVFFISPIAGTDDVTLHAFPEQPFDSKQQCQFVTRQIWDELQLKLNKKYETEGVEYPPMCVTERQLQEVTGKPT